MCACHSEMIDMADICSTNLQSYPFGKLPCILHTM